MKKAEIFDFLAEGLSGGWRQFLTQGIVFMGVGILILLMPELVAVMAASFFMLAGLSLLVLAWRARKFHKDYYERFRVEIEDIFD